MNFDEYIDRNEYPAMKWSRSFLSEHFGNENAIPMSVADMDFRAPPDVIAHLKKRAAHGIYGYETKPDSYFKAFKAWYLERHAWKIDSQHIEPCPSILNAMSVLIDQHSSEGDGIILQTPVFFEFKMVIRSSKRKLVKNPLMLIDGKYQIDFDDLENRASNPNNKILILCNPHNPVGRVWTRTELEKVLEICERHDIFVIADEIHGDFALPPHTYTPFLTVSEKASDNGAACVSPAKTFNISGMVDAIAVIPNDDFRNQFHEFAHRYQINKVNVFASVATEAAYRHGAEWLDGLLTYVQRNVALLREYLTNTKLPISLVEPEGTFLAWLDFRELGMDVKALDKFLAQKAGIAIAPGYWFGREGAGFGRMTIGCPRSTLQRALDGLASAIENLPL